MSKQLLTRQMNPMIHSAGSEGNTLTLTLLLVEHMEMIHLLLFREHILKNKYLVLSTSTHKTKLLTNIEPSLPVPEM